VLTGLQVEGRKKIIQGWVGLRSTHAALVGALLPFFPCILRFNLRLDFPLVPLSDRPGLGSRNSKHWQNLLATLSIPDPVQSCYLTFSRQFELDRTHQPRGRCALVPPNCRDVVSSTWFVFHCGSSFSTLTRTGTSELRPWFFLGILGSQASGIGFLLVLLRTISGGANLVQPRGCWVTAGALPTRI
jgi:hypothetical protein